MVCVRRGARAVGRGIGVRSRGGSSTTSFVDSRHGRARALGAKRRGRRVLVRGEHRRTLAQQVHLERVWVSISRLHDAVSHVHVFGALGHRSGDRSRAETVHQIAKAVRQGGHDTTLCSP